MSETVAVVTEAGQHDFAALRPWLPFFAGCLDASAIERCFRRSIAPDFRRYDVGFPRVTSQPPGTTQV
jgi:hypothetical protein